MSKILVTDDTEAARVQVMPMADPELTWDADDRDPFYVAQCRTVEPDGSRCEWNSFADEGTIHLTEADAINDAEGHLDRHE
jgi:hypothetical protein